MANVMLLAPKILKWEGGFVIDPIDKGGATNKGITITTFKSFFGQEKTVEDLKKLTEEQFEIVLKSLFWDKWKADLIQNQSIANILVDWVWGSGKWGIQIPQRLLGLVEDGIVGVQTLLTLNQQNPLEFFNKIYRARIAFLDQIVANHPEQIRFIVGWKNRLADFKFAV